MCSFCNNHRCTNNSTKTADSNIQKKADYKTRQKMPLSYLYEADSYYDMLDNSNNGMVPMINRKNTSSFYDMPPGFSRMPSSFIRADEL